MGNIFYISVTGSSSWNNSSPNSPTNILQLISNQASLLPGDEIYFKRGDTFNQSRQLDLVCNGTLDKKIKLGAYGDINLPKPIITFKSELSNWKDSTKWSLVTGTDVGPNIWSFELKSDFAIDRCWDGDTELKAAYYYKLESYVPKERVLKLGDNGDGTVGVCKEHQFCYDSNNDKFYIYSPNGNPANNFTKIIIPGTIYNIIADRYGLKIQGNNLIFENLDFRGAFYSTVGLQSCQKILFNNCNIGYDSNWSGISNVPGYVSKNIEIAYCKIDSNWDYNYIFYTQRTPYGINLTNGSSYWDIHHSLIKDWWMNIFVIANGKNSTVKNSQYHMIHHNEITSRCTFGKAIQISAGGIFESDPNTYVHFYNNNVHDIVFGMQISAYSNYVYFNVFKNMLLDSTNEHGIGDGGFIAHIISDTQQLGPPFYNYFINNTISNTRYYINTFQGKEIFWINNLIVDAGLDIAYITKVSQYGNGQYKNNIFYKRNTTYSSKLIQIENVGVYSISEFNLLNGQYDKIITNNKQYIGDVNSLINSDYTIPNTSIAKQYGTSISSFTFLPTQLFDMNNNIVNKDSLNVGAYSSGTTTVSLPIIITQPSDVVITYGQSATIKVVSNNTDLYQWQEIINGTWTNLQNENTDTLFINNPDITTEIAPQIITEPTDITVNDNSIAIFSVEAIGTKPLTYNWYVNDFVINNNNLNTLTLNNVDLFMNGNIYKCIITNKIGTVTTKDVKLTVINVVDDNRVKTNLRILYRFNEGSGNTINNVSGTDVNYNLTIKTRIKGE